MSLHPMRARTSLRGALTGAFAAVALVARLEGRRLPAVGATVASLVCGSLSVAYEDAVPGTVKKRCESGSRPVQT